MEDAGKVRQLQEDCLFVLAGSSFLLTVHSIGHVYRLVKYL